MRGELGAGISAECMASANPSSKRRVRRVKTERMRKMTIRAFIERNMMRPLRMLVVRIWSCDVCSSEQRKSGCGEEGFSEARRARQLVYRCR